MSLRAAEASLRLTRARNLTSLPWSKSEMDQVLFDQDDKVAVHEEGAIKLIRKAFTSHEDGVPEWIKDSSDMYARRNTAPDESVIVALLRDAKAGAAMALVGGLDFGGMSTQDI